MAVLSDADRFEVYAELMREFSGERSSVGITKLEFRAVIDAADVWADAQAAEFNAALPQPGRSALNARQKAWILGKLLKKRFEVTP